MQSNPDQQIDWRVSGRRIVVHAVVIGMHLGMVMVLLRGPISLWHVERGGATRAREILQLRFVSMVARKPRTVVAATTPSTMRVRRRSTASTAQSAAHPAIATTPPAPPTATATPIDGPGYISGGNLLNGTGQFHHSAAHLPGSAVVIVPGLHMIDPRMQGVGGAVRKLQVLFGVPNPHCVDVDAWRTLSTQDLFDRHLSPQQVESTAAQYHCLPRHA